MLPQQQLSFWETRTTPKKSSRAKFAAAHEVNPHDYDHIIVGWSGGKDSLACILDLLERGVNKSVIELWHHDVDGRSGSKLMDWPVTRSYCKAVADALGLPIFYSWREGGFEREMLKSNERTAPVCYETPTGLGRSGGTKGKLNTRRLFPQLSASLTTRWCSGTLKVDVCSAAITGQKRFHGKRVLVVTGERAEESKNRACYQTFEAHRTNAEAQLKRFVHQWRPVHKWTEQQVWDIIRKYRINPHPCYKLGWGRCSCSACIFGSKNQWASLAHINPCQVKAIVDYEIEFGKTIHRKLPVTALIAQGTPHANMDPDDIRVALSDHYGEPVILPEAEWKLPAGAFGESAGPV